MPHGWERKAMERRLEKELRQARAAELAAADNKQRARIEKEIGAEIDRRLKKLESPRWLPFDFLHF
jgi:hypothetical protein